MALKPLMEQAPPLSQAGLTRRTALNHVSTLTRIQKVLERKPKTQPLPEALVNAFQQLKQERGYGWATQHRNMGSMVGVMALLPLYTTEAHGVNLMQAPVWRQAMAAAARLSAEETPRTPLAATSQQVHQAISRAADPATKAMLALAWATTMRLGDVAQLQKQDVALEADNTLRVRFRKSKTARAVGGAHTVHTKLPKQWRRIVSSLLLNTATDAPLFPKDSATIPTATAALKVIDATLEARSLRRGALQTLAESGTPHEDLMAFSGHKNVATLLRYLGWGWTTGPRRPGRRCTRLRWRLLGASEGRRSHPQRPGAKPGGCGNSAASTCSFAPAALQGRGSIA